MESKSILIQPYSIHSHDIDEKYVITLFGYNSDNKNITINVLGYKPFYYIRVKNNDDISEKQADEIVSSIAKAMKLLYIDYKIEKRRELYSSTGKLVSLIRVSFESLEKVKHSYNLIKKYPMNGHTLIPIEYMVPKQIRENQVISQVMKFLEEKNLSYTSWMIISNPKKTSLCLSKDPEEYDVNCNDVSLADKFEYAIHPSTLSFDLETHKHKRYGPGDPANFIASNTIVYQEKGKKPIIICQVIAKKCSKIEMEGVKIIYYEKELDLIDDFAKIINEFNPALILQFNGFKFDLPYIEGRLQICGKRLMDNISKLQKNESFWVNKEKISSATSDGGIKAAYFHAPGRIYLDMYLNTRRTEPNLPTYKLKDILKKHLGESKVDLNYEALNIAIRLCNGEYIPKNTKEHKIELIKSVNRECNKKYTGKEWETQEFRDDVLRTMLIYNIGDTIHLHELMFKVRAFTNLMEEANVMRIQPMESHIELQQHKIFPSIYAGAKRMGYFLMIPDWVTSYKYQGGNVYPPIRGLWHLVDVLDFQSLYPSIIRAFNMCYTTYDKEGKYSDEDCHICKWIVKDNEGNPILDENGKEQIKIHRFVKPHIRKGILPSILEELASERKRYKKLMEENEGNDLESIFNSRQLTVKGLMNSMYGILGMGTGGMCLFEAAEACTAMARKAQAYAYKWLQSKGYKVIYGDTDSVFYVKESDTLEDVLKGRGKNNSIEISKNLPSPIFLEYEKTYKVLALEDKKAYFAYLLDPKDPESFNDKNFKTVGVKEKKRDCPEYIGSVGKELMKNYVLKGKSKDECVKFIEDKISELFEGKHDNELGLVMIYTSKVYARVNDKHALFNNSLLNDGIQVQEGDRFRAFYTITEEEEEIIKNNDPETAMRLIKRLKVKVGNKLRTEEQMKMHKLRLDYNLYEDKIIETTEKHLNIAFG